MGGGTPAQDPGARSRKNFRFPGTNGLTRSCPCERIRLSRVGGFQVAEVTLDLPDPPTLKGSISVDPAKAEEVTQED